MKSSNSAGQLSGASVDAKLESLRGIRVLLAGLGNIGSYLAPLLAPLVQFVRLVDRDTIESHNAFNQLYGPNAIGQSKVDATAERIGGLAPELRVERRKADLEDLPWGDFADIDVAFAGLDSLRARQVLAERLYPLQIPYIDGAVGDPVLVRVQVLLPGHACLECGWSAAHYRQLAAEYPCSPGASASGPPTPAPGCAGAATAGLMVAQCARLFGDDPPCESYELNGELLTGQLRLSRRRSNDRCRFTHPSAPTELFPGQRCDELTFRDLASVVRSEFPEGDLQLEFRRGVLDRNLFGTRRFARLEEFDALQHVRLTQFGLVPTDRIVVHATQGSPVAHICLHSNRGRR